MIIKTFGSRILHRTLGLFLTFLLVVAPSVVRAQSCAPAGVYQCIGGFGGACPGGFGCTPCANDCVAISLNESQLTIRHTDQEFIQHERWLVDVVFNQNLLPALMLFAEQITAMAMHQVAVIGALLDAKHQLETQRLFQTMTAQAHKDYHPSEGMCTFGTMTRSLAASERNVDLTAITISNRLLQRELHSGDAMATRGQTSDYLSRFKQFRELYCNQADNAQGLRLTCPQPSADRSRMDNDISYTTLVDAPLTLKLDFTAQGIPDHQTNRHIQTVSADEEDVFALSSNLYAHFVPPAIPEALLNDANNNGIMNETGAQHYMDIRAIAAKRSVARNSFSSIAAMKAQGQPEVQPYMYAIMNEFGITNPQDIRDYLGDRPSYYAQMEVLTKKMYQNPIFYTELYDKPVNVARKEVAMQAIDLMQKRDIYRSMLRSEAILSVMLETALEEQQDDIIVNEIPRLSSDEKTITVP